MNYKKIAKTASLLLPQIIPLGYRYLKRKSKRSDLYLKTFTPQKFKAIRKNKILNNLHKGQHCFILGTAASINNHDMMLLKNEHKIFLSQFYLHKQYNLINPKYHLFNDLGGHPSFDQKAMLNHYKQVDEMIAPSVNLFFRYEYDYDFIKIHELFKNRNIYYISQASSMNYLLKDGLDASKYFYHPAGCAVLGIQLALCMGFKEIYLLGIELTNTTTYFYNTKHSHLTQSITQVNKGMVEKQQKSFAEKVKMQKLGVHVSEQYQTIEKYCKIHGVKIYNCSKTSALNLFPYKDFESILDK